MMNWVEILTQKFLYIIYTSYVDLLQALGHTVVYNKHTMVKSYVEFSIYIYIQIIGNITYSIIDFKGMLENTSRYLSYTTTYSTQQVFSLQQLQCSTRSTTKIIVAMLRRRASQNRYQQFSQTNFVHVIQYLQNY